MNATKMQRGRIRELERSMLRSERWIGRLGWFLCGACVVQVGILAALILLGASLQTIGIQAGMVVLGFLCCDNN